ncbi:TIGR02206 family membrane protein [Alkaliphilus pronyensis]|uniref:TIGR02206 family membrane protein n=1 Tax=Alkaliphilus pronyensis TaxID=1482732 RepID=A0A6I0EXB0_9FIRM|nr:TIGR02206 family membrane protein [Alkaliphilus pronyensis]KAB3533464.1 TIGR02206 family membrane protein [Alkaliphilus pronyensis]
MHSFFGPAPIDKPFVLFGQAHLIMLIVMFTLIFLIYLLRHTLRAFKYEKNLRWILGFTLIFTQMAYGLNNAYNGIGSIQKDLPLSLCGASMILVGILLINMNKGLFEILYFWGIVGVIQALITPNLGPYGPTHFRFYQFAVGHIGIIVSIIYLVFVHKFKPNHRSIYKSLLALLIFTAFVLVFNVMFDANYLFLLKSPENKSALDLFPKFPWNTLVLFILSWCLFYLAYLPFVFTGKKEKSATVTNE